MNVNSGVGDNAAGRYFGGSRRGGGSMFQNNRQMRQYMQMRRDEMSHGAFLANQNEELANQRGEVSADKAFNRESLRTDANVQQNDWQKTRNTFHTGEVRKTDPNITSYKTDGNSFSFGAEPGLHATGRAAEERFREMQESGNPLVTGEREAPLKTTATRVRPAIGAPPVRSVIAAPAKQKATRMSAKTMQARVDSGELSQAEATAQHSGYAARVGRDRADDNAGKPPAPIRQGVEYVAGVGSVGQFGGTTAGAGLGSVIK